MNTQELLIAGLADMGVRATGHQIDQLQNYIAEIELWNPKLGLVKAAGHDLVIRHVLDSAAAVPFLDTRMIPKVSIADIGSGAGLPGIPLAILFPHATVSLVERSARRVGFLKNALLAAGIPNCRVVQADLSEYEESVDVIVYRAFHPLTASLLHAMSARLRPHGLICAYKGRVHAIEEELQALRQSQNQVHPGQQLPLHNQSGTDHSESPRIVPVRVPFLDEDRHLLIFDWNDRSDQSTDVDLGSH